MAKPVQARESREPYWRQVVDRWKRSGLAVPAFCRREGLNQATFYHWRMRSPTLDRLRARWFSAFGWLTTCWHGSA
jgi:hypothetical protein